MPEPLSNDELRQLVESNARSIEALTNEMREGFAETNRTVGLLAQMMAIGFGAQSFTNRDVEQRIRELERWQRQQEGNPEN